MGNSEVGHLNLGAGAIVQQDLTRIDDAVADGSFFENEALRAACAAARESGRLHLLGLVSDGGVHASMDHLRALLELARREGVPDVVLHAFTDGRDTLPDSGAGYLAEAEAGWPLAGARRVTGRYYAMDRDRRWDRTKRAWDALVHGEAEAPHAESGEAAVRAAYERGETDEFIQPTLVGRGGPHPRRRRGALLQLPPRPRAPAHARAGRAELRGVRPWRRAARRVDHADRVPGGLGLPGRLPAGAPERHAGRRCWPSAASHQLHVAETEKYAHVTYFFNGGEEHPYEGEERRLVDSPRDVPTYDHKPEMSARAAAAAFVEGWRGGDYGFGIINFANPDMVGHTGVIPAAVKAIETVDECLGQVVEAVHATGGACVITADHGNADHMLEPDGSPNTAHSLNPVP